MIRDMDVIRRIALAVADAPHGNHVQHVDGVSKADFSANAVWMEEAGLVALMKNKHSR